MAKINSSMKRGAKIPVSGKGTGVDAQDAKTLKNVARSPQYQQEMSNSH